MSLFDQIASSATIHQPEEFKKKLASGKPLRVKYGIDPTAASVHLGHLVGLLKFKQLVDAGHKGIIIIGDFTASVGDPTGRDQTRARLTPTQIKANSESYMDQIRSVISLRGCEIWYNNVWFGKKTMAEVVELMAQVTAGQLLARDDFSNRMKASEPVYLHEMLYPVLQGFDSVEVKADVEIGGNDQLFNFMLARDMQKKAGQDQQVCVTVPILVGTDGVRRMGKSLNNYIGVDEGPDSVFSKTMSITDEMIDDWWRLLPVDDQPLPEVGPMDRKKALAFRLTKFLCGELVANVTRDAWHRRFTLRQDPENIPVVDISRQILKDGKVGICHALKACGLVSSNNEARKIIAPPTGNSGVTVGDATIEDPTTEIVMEDGMIFRVGRRRIARVRLTD